MKFHRILTTICCLILFSCQTDINDVTLENQTNAPSKYRAPIETSNIPASLLESRMQWVSYFAAKVLLHSDAARHEASELISNDTVLLRKLIGNDSEAKIFNILFFEYMVSYLTESNRSEGIEEHPPGGIDVCCTQPGAPAEDRAYRFVQHMTQENCIELYFPNNLNTSVFFNKITSTAHPLNDNSHNYGFKRLLISNPALGSTFQVDRVSDLYVQTNGVTVVARPIHGSTCDYNGYGVEDFTLFLDTN